MGSEFTFYDYVDGTNVIRPWLDDLPLAVKVKFEHALLHLEALGPGDWTRPQVDTLTDEDCAGLFEIRAKKSRHQYRILGCHGPGDRSPTLLHCFIKPGARVPPAECRVACRRRDQLLRNPSRHREEHVYGTG